MRCSPRLRPPALPALVLAGSLVLSGCGSTLLPSGGSGSGLAGAAAAGGGQAAGGAGSAGSAATGADTGTGPGAGSTGAGSAAGAGAAGSGARGADGAAAAGSGGADTGAGTPAGGSATGPGHGALAPIEIGYIHLANYGAAQQAAGQSGLGGVDEQQVFEALAADLNKHGGILGHPVRLVRFDRDTTDQTTTNDTWQQRECTAFTQDAHVFAVFAGEGRVLDPCLNKAHVLEICGGCEISTYDDGDYAKLPYLFEPTGASVSRVVPFYARGLSQSGFFTGSAVKIGLIAFDNPTFRRAYTQLAGALKQYGQTLSDAGFVQESQSAQDYGPALTQLQNYELKFKGEGINRILVFDEGGAILGYGTVEADKQQYYPEWGVNSTSAPAALASSGSYDPASERTNQTVVGWVPGGDEGYEQSTTEHPPGLAACLATLHAYGITASGDNAEVAAGQDCDAFGFLHASLERGGAVTVPAFSAGAAALGSSFASAVVYGTEWTGSRRDGAGVYRTAAYSSDCSCFRYRGGRQPM